MAWPNLIIIPLVLIAVASDAAGTWVILPSAGVGNVANDAPFLIAGSAPSMRYQQVYDASRFSGVGSAGGFVIRISFVVDQVNNQGIGGARDAQLNLSTTVKRPDGLSAVFAENVGTDDTRVFGPGRVPILADAAGCVPARSVCLLLSRAFYYNPSQGNLLLDVRNYSEGYLNGFDTTLAMDAANVAGDSVSRVYAESVNATEATRVDTIGLVTGFEFQPVPSLNIEVQTNSIEISWPAEPSVFVLQSTETLGTNANWLTVTNTIGGNESVRILTLPNNSLGHARFFRLFWNGVTTSAQLNTSPQAVSIRPEQRWK